MNKRNILVLLSVALAFGHLGLGQAALGNVGPQPAFAPISGSGGVLFGSRDLSVIDDGGITFDNTSVGTEILLELTPGYAFSGGTDALSFFDNETGGAAHDAGESADIFVSVDGLDYSPIGTIVGGETPRTLSFPGDSFRFLKLVNTAMGSDGFDLDLVAARNVVVVPEPAAFALGFGALMLVGMFGRRWIRR